MLAADEKDDFTREGLVQYDSVSYIGNSREMDLVLLDEALKKNGDFGVYGDISEGLAELLMYMYLSVEHRENQLIVTAAPLSGEGHDLSFRVNLINRSIDNLVVGEIIPPPDF